MHKKGLSDYVYYLGSARQASDYEKTTDYQINHVRKTFSFRNNIGMALENLEEYDMLLHHPTLQVSTLTDAAAKAAEDKQFEIEFKAEYDGYMKCKQELETNMSTAHAVLWEQCA
jgi:hypothetical protein